MAKQIIIYWYHQLEKHISGKLLAVSNYRRCRESKTVSFQMAMAHMLFNILFSLNVHIKHIT